MLRLSHYLQMVVRSFFLQFFIKIIDFHFDLQKPIQNERFFCSLLRRSNGQHKKGHLVW